MSEQLSLFDYREPVWLEASRAEQFDASAERFIAEHPDAWREFVRFTFQLIRAGREHGGAKAVWERLRWDVELSAHHSSRDWALNNNLVASIGRAFERAYPQHEGFFRKRSRPSEANPATEAA